MSGDAAAIALAVIGGVMLAVAGSQVPTSRAWLIAGAVFVLPALLRLWAAVLLS